MISISQISGSLFVVVFFTCIIITIISCVKSHKYKKQKESLEQSYCATSNRLSIIAQENYSLKQYIDDTNNSTAVAVVDNSKLQRELEHYKSECSKLNLKLTSIEEENKELREFKDNSKHQESNYRDRVASLQGTQKAEIDNLQKIISDLRKQLANKSKYEPTEDGLPTYEELRAMYNKLVRTYNEISKRPVVPEVKVVEKEVYIDPKQQELDESVIVLSRLLSEYKTHSFEYVQQYYPEDFKQITDMAIKVLRLRMTTDKKFLGCTNQSMRKMYIESVTLEYGIRPLFRKKTDLYEFANNVYKQIHMACL
jgi:hypothetical protein